METKSQGEHKALNDKDITNLNSRTTIEMTLKLVGK
jgi:hypothetical protein